MSGYDKGGDEEGYEPYPGDHGFPQWSPVMSFAEASRHMGLYAYATLDANEWCAKVAEFMEIPVGELHFHAMAYEAYENNMRKIGLL